MEVFPEFLSSPDYCNFAQRKHWYRVTLSNGKIILIIFIYNTNFIQFYSIPGALGSYFGWTFN